MNPTMDIPRVPYNEQAEQGLLGSLLIDNRMLEKAEGLKPEHFCAPAHQRIFGAIQEIVSAGRSASPITLRQKFENDNDLAGVGGGEYLNDLAASIITVCNVPDYTEVIKEQHSRRLIQDAAMQLLNLARDGEPKALLSSAEQIMTAMHSQEDAKPCTAIEAGVDALAWMDGVAKGRITPAMTGYGQIDEMTGGLFPGRLYIVAARPGMGKTAFALSLADNISGALPCLFFSLEMTRQELAQRLFASRCGIAITSQQRPTGLTDSQWQQLSNARLPDNITIDDAGGTDINRIRMVARRFKRKHPSFVLMIDYLGLMALDRSINNKVHQIEDVTTGLKALSKELGVPIVLLSQLSRAVEGRDDKVPTLSDLRDSGAIEQDADAVMFIYRHEYYKEREEPRPKSGDSAAKTAEKMNEWLCEMAACRGKADIIIAKNRQGKTGKVMLAFSGERQRFS